jgi:hypothetical protein
MTVRLKMTEKGEVAILPRNEYASGNLFPRACD